MANTCFTNYTIFSSHETLSEIADAVNAAIRQADKNRKAFADKRAEMQKAGLPEEEIQTRLLELKLPLSAYLALVLRCLGIDKNTIDTRRLTENIRGYVSSMEKVESNGKVIELTLHCETAWNESNGFRHLLREKYGTDDFEMFYTAEESGCEVYCTNDPDHADDVVVDAESYDVLTTTKGGLKETLEDILEDTFDTLEETLEYVDKRNEDADENCTDNHIWIHEYEYCDD